MFELIKKAFNKIGKRAGWKELLSLAYGACLVIYGAIRGPVTSDEALYWITRRSYALLLSFPFGIILHGFSRAYVDLSANLDGAAALNLTAKPMIFIASAPLSFLSQNYWTMVLPTALLLAAFFYYGLKKLHLTIGYFIWCAIVTTSPLLWLFGSSVTGNVAAGVCLAFALIVADEIGEEARLKWFYIGLLLSCGIMFHYSALPPALLVVIYCVLKDKIYRKTKSAVMLSAGLGIPVLLAFFLTLIIQSLVALKFGQVLNGNYLQELFHQFHSTGDSAASFRTDYLVWLSNIEAGWMYVVFFLSYAVWLLFGKKTRNLLMASSVLTILVLLLISLVPVHAARTLGLFLPFLLLAVLQALCEFSSGYDSLGISGRLLVFGFAVVCLGVMVYGRWPYLMDLLHYRDLGSMVQREVSKRYADLGDNPYIEGKYFHFFRYSYLENLHGQTPLKNWRRDARVWAYELDPVTIQSGRDFVIDCRDQRGGQLVELDWSKFSKYHWGDFENNFGSSKPAPFVLCVAGSK